MLARALGLGPLEPLLADPRVTDVMVNGGGRVWIDRDGQLSPTDLVLSEPHFPAVGARGHHVTTEEWLARARALEPEDDEPALPRSANDPLRILRTSGTTGRAKRGGKRSAARSPRSSPTTSSTT